MKVSNIYTSHKVVEVATPAPNKHTTPVIPVTPPTSHDSWQASNPTSPVPITQMSDDESPQDNVPEVQLHSPQDSNTNQEKLVS